MKPATYITKRTLVCPTCDGQTGRSIDHLINGGKATVWGPVNCDACGVGVKVTIDAMGQTFVESAPNDLQHNIVTLVVLPPQKEPMYFLINGNSWTKAPGEEVNLDKSYYINEHSCPTNWLRDIETIQIGNDADPHGVILHVRSMKLSDYQNIVHDVRVRHGWGDRGGSSDVIDRDILEHAFPEVADRFVPDSDYGFNDDAESGWTEFVKVQQPAAYAWMDYKVRICHK